MRRMGMNVKVAYEMHLPAHDGPPPWNRFLSMKTLQREIFIARVLRDFLRSTSPLRAFRKRPATLNGR